MSNTEIRRLSLTRVLTGLCLLVMGLVLLIQLFFLAQVLFFRWYDPPTSAHMRAEAMRLAERTPPIGIRHQWVDYEKISRNAKRAVIAAEDSGFMAHSGIEWDAIERAYRINQTAGGVRQGGSTITMQLAKNLFLSSDRSYLRKVQELVIAIMIELSMDKRRILELYLNMVEFGEGVFGIEAAARHYFGTSAANLSPRQAAWLASILPAPRRYDKHRKSSWVEKKTGILMRDMSQVQVP